MPRTCNLCDLVGEFGTGCGGLQLINAGLSALTVGQVISVPPCTIAAK